MVLPSTKKVTSAKSYSSSISLAKCFYGVDVRIDITTRIVIIPLQGFHAPVQRFVSLRCLSLLN